MNFRKVKFQFKEQAKLQPVSTIKTDSRFSDQLPIEGKLFARLVESMKGRGFDRHHPLLCQLVDGELVVVDGHSRLRAAIEAGLTHVWVTTRQYANHAEAVKATIDEQLDRRNLSIRTLIHILRDYKKHSRMGRPKGKQTSKSETDGDKVPSHESPQICGLPGIYKLSQLAERTEFSERQLSSLVRIIREGTPELIEQICSSEITIYAGEQSLVNRGNENPKKPTLKSVKVLEQVLSPSLLEWWVPHCASRKEDPVRGVRRLVSAERANLVSEHPKAEPLKSKFSKGPADRPERHFIWTREANIAALELMLGDTPPDEIGKRLAARFGRCRPSADAVRVALNNLLRSLRQKDRAPITDEQKRAYLAKLKTQKG